MRAKSSVETIGKILVLDQTFIFGSAQPLHVNNMNIKCRLCGKESVDLQQWESHMVAEHKPRTTRWKIINSAFQGRVFELAFMYDSTDSLEEALGQKMIAAVKRQIKFYRRLHGQIKYSMTFGAMMRREMLEETYHETFFFRSEEKRCC